MYVGIIQVELRLHAVNTLKERRRIVNSLKERVRQRFKISIAEVGIADLHREATLGMALVSCEGAHARNRCRAIVEYIENDCEAEVVDSQIEVI